MDQSFDDNGITINIALESITPKEDVQIMVSPLSSPS